MASANPATLQTRNEFRNTCTSVLQGLDCLHRQRTVLNDAMIAALTELGNRMTLLRSDVDNNTDYHIDGPLVRFLTSETKKAQAIIQEMKRTCSESSIRICGESYYQQHINQHYSEIQSVLQEIERHYNDAVYRRDTAVPPPVDVQTPWPPKYVPPEQVNTVKTEEDTSKYPGTAGSQRSVRFSPQVEMTSSVSPQEVIPSSQEVMTSPQDVLRSDAMNPTPSAGTGYKMSTSSTPGVFEHMHDMTKTHPIHSDSWPENTTTPTSVFDRKKPPLVYPGLRDVHNYRNLPQFTGLNLPVPNYPNGELGLRAPHVQHWDYHNNVRY
ncbi:uncharacterized protein LOC117107269 [Anneissia japonica]|uniref:uncharacterized protein LOC117107269 n=1 Tax=Anneissia japonica TaxID=1529436 RepID=UPI0014258365|nr:uncharacterized protein LOC117107269 [Anneissia japonica]